MNPGREKDYPLDFVSVLRHVATQMEEARVGARAVSIDDMAASYQHPNLADLVRVRRVHGLAGDDEARRFLVERAIQSMDGRVEEVDGGYRLAKPLASIRYPADSGMAGKAFRSEPDPHRVLQDPFNRMSTTVQDDVRPSTERRSGADDELRESMKTFGWLKHLPAIKDERGVVILGHRRLAMADELGITANVQVVNFGNGDQGDLERFKHAIGSNLGAKGLSQDARRRLAIRLYGEDGWTMARIAEWLDVTAMTISNDLREFKGGLNPGGRGRPRKDRPKLTSQEKTAQFLEEVTGTTVTPTVSMVANTGSTGTGCPDCGHVTPCGGGQA